jgi:hypothetical protein
VGTAALGCPVERSSTAEFLKGTYVGRLSPSAVFCEAFGGLSVVMA